MPSASNTGRSITAYYHEPGGRYSTNTVAGSDVNQALAQTTDQSAAVLGKQHQLDDFVARGSEEMVLRPFDRGDYVHLGLIPPEEEPNGPAGGGGPTGGDAPEAPKPPLTFRMPPPPQE